MATAHELELAIAAFAPIGLAEMDGVKLLDRCDTKYALPDAVLPGVLHALLPEYRLLEVGGARGIGYRSLYLDTPGFNLYHDHHNGRGHRSKVRFREYLGSDLCFLEVKRKTGRGDTEKKRMRIGQIPGTMSEEQRTFVKARAATQADLVPVLWNHYTRFTFVHRQRAERLTIDRTLRFSSGCDERAVDGLCIAELKQARADQASPFARLMRAMGTRPGGISKYCLGVLLLHPWIKHNAFNEALRRIDRIRRTA